MAREGKSYMQIANQWRRITDELERRSGGVEYCITGEHNIALYEKATEAAARYTRNIEHTPDGLKPHTNEDSERFLNTIFSRSDYMQVHAKPEHVAQLTGSQVKPEDRIHFENATVFRMKDGSYAMRGTYEGQYLTPKKFTNSEWQQYFNATGHEERSAVLQNIMVNKYKEDMLRNRQSRKSDLTL